MKVALIETHYLPSISYFSAIQHFDKIILEKHEFFVKQSFRNRCLINTSQGVDTLIIPLTAKHGKTPVCDVRIDYRQKWLNNHWRTLQSAYGNAPFFEFYADDFHQVLFRKFEFLYDLNYHILSLCLGLLKIQKTVLESASYSKTPGSGVFDLRNVINAKNPTGSNKYYKAAAYGQVFGNMFVKNLSLVDLIFCTGPEAGKFVRSSSHEAEQN